MTDTSSPGDRMARVEVLQTHIAAQITTLIEDLRRDRESNKRDFVPRLEYEADREGDDRRTRGIEDELKVQAGFRRQVQAALIAGFILLLIPVVGTVASFAR
jgi:hypothetical protein